MTPSHLLASVVSFTAHMLRIDPRRLTSVYHLTNNSLSFIVIYMFMFALTHPQQPETTPPQGDVEALPYTMTPGGTRHARQRNPGDTRMVGRPLAQPVAISPMSVPWGPVTWLAPGIAEWVATLHFAATGRTDALAPWLAAQAGRTDVDARRLLSGATKWPLDNLALLLRRYGYIGGIDYRGDMLTLVEDNDAMADATLAWSRRVFQRATGDKMTGTKFYEWLLADAAQYGDAVVRGGMAGVSSPSKSHASLMARGGSPIGTYVLYRIARAADARGMWTSPTAPAIAMPGGLVMRTMAWSGRPVELGRYGSAPEPMHMEGTDNGK